jgi:hypothetical protein
MPPTINLRCGTKPGLVGDDGARSMRIGCVRCPVGYGHERRRGLRGRVWTGVQAKVVSCLTTCDRMGSVQVTCCYGSGRTEERIRKRKGDVLFFSWKKVSLFFLFGIFYFNFCQMRWCIIVSSMQGVVHGILNRGRSIAASRVRARGQARMQGCADTRIRSKDSSRVP